MSSLSKQFQEDWLNSEHNEPSILHYGYSSILKIEHSHI